MIGGGVGGDSTSRDKKFAKIAIWGNPPFPGGRRFAPVRQLRFGTLVHQQENYFGCVISFGWWGFPAFDTDAGIHMGGGIGAKIRDGRPRRRGTFPFNGRNGEFRIELA